MKITPSVILLAGSFLIAAFIVAIMVLKNT